MLQDPRGHPVSTTSSDALEHAERSLWRLVSFYGDPIAELDATIAADPGWALARLMKATFLCTLTEPALMPQARAEFDAARALMAHANARERGHFAAAELCLAGRWADACRVWDETLRAHPRDLLALISAHLFDFYRGDAANLRQRVARVLPEWPEDDPLTPYVLGMFAFGLEECNLYPQAEDAGRRALEARRDVPWAVHAVAHVLEMQGRHADGKEWLRARHADWALDNGLAVHNWWHLALFHLETLDTSHALELFDAEIGHAGTVNLQWLDAAALLWRLELLGADVGARWAALAAKWTDPVAHAGHYAFNDAHALMALMRSGDHARAAALLDAVRERAAAPAGAAGADNQAMARDVGVPLMQGLVDFSQGRMRACVDRLAPLRTTAHRFGGSHAQRDLIDQTLLAACARGADRAFGRALLNERRCAKPGTPLTEYWARQVNVCAA